jgi:hypothetical protein
VLTPGPSVCGQIRYQAERAGLAVEGCGLVSGTDSGVPQALSTPPSSPHAGKDYVWLVARKPAREPE